MYILRSFPGTSIPLLPGRLQLLAFWDFDSIHFSTAIKDTLQNNALFCSLQGLPLGTPMRLMSPLRPANSTLKTPSPVRIGPSSYFATPGGLPRTPLSESMQLTAWLRDTLAGCSAEVRLYTCLGSLHGHPLLVCCPASLADHH